MIPLSLYAMAGLACILTLEGEERKACELYHYVKHHPKTPTPYLEQAARWMGKLDNGILQESCLSMSKGEELETIDEVVVRLLE